MKKYILTTTLVIASILAYAQTVTFENLETFDKITVKDGEVKQIEITPFAVTKQKVKLENISKDDVDYSLSAGNLTIDLKGNSLDKLVVYNRYIKRLELENNAEIIGAEYLGENGNYLITDIDNTMNFAKNVDIRIPDIQIPTFNFNEDFDFGFDFGESYQFDFKEHISEEEWQEYKSEMNRVGEEMKMASKEVKEEVRRVMKEVKKEMERIKEERDN